MNSQKMVEDDDEYCSQVVPTLKFLFDESVQNLLTDPLLTGIIHEAHSNY